MIWKLKEKAYILCLLLCLATGGRGLMAQEEGLVSPVYGWHAYTSHKAVFEIAIKGDSAYAVTAGGLLVHNIITGENTALTTVDGLSSVDPSAVFADPSSQNVYIGFKDGNINYIDPTGQIHIITDIARNQQFTSKRINHFFSKDGLLYIATDFGVVVYDIAGKETKYSITKISTNPTASLVNSVTVSQDRIWVAMGLLGVWSVDMNAPNPALPTLWRYESGLSGLPVGRSYYICSDKDLLFAQVQDTVFQKWPNQNWEHSNLHIGNWNYLNSANGNVFGTFRRSGLVVLYPDSNMVVQDNFGKIMCNAITRNGDVMIGDSLGGLQEIQFGVGFSEVGPACPRNNNVEDMAAFNGELYIAPKGRVGSSNRAYDKSGVPFFDLHKEGWTILDYIVGPLTDVYQDFYCVAIDTSSGRCIVGSWGEGLVELLHGEYVRSYTAANSGLQMGTTGHLVSGLAFDEAGNLWISQFFNDAPLQCLTPEGEWYSYNPPAGILALGLSIDELGNKWMISSGAGITVFNDNYTPGDPRDDQWKVLTSTFGQGALPNNTVYCVTQDHDLQIWIGTSEGVTIMYDPTLLFTQDFQDAACPIIEGYCLFRDQQVNDIVVDGYNRKWIATENGVFLVNLDGTELLKHFNAANSPLFDDDVRSIAVDPGTGEVFFGTAKGVVSYIGDAIDGRPNAESLYAYPNPAFVDQASPIMIKGMRKFSKVKVTTVDGRLVRELDSQGGEVPWDLNDSYGNRVVPGIYLLMVSDPDGKGAGIAKIAILEEQRLK